MNLKSGGQGSSFPDPYYLWAVATQFVDYGHPPDTYLASVLVECVDLDAVNGLARDLERLDPGGRMARLSVMSKRFLWPARRTSPARSRFLTLDLAVGWLHKLDKAPLAKWIVRWEMALPLCPDTVRGSGASEPPPLGQKIDAKVVAAVIDDYVDPGQPAFHDERGESRIAQVWRQGTSERRVARRRASHGTAVAGLLCGRGVMVPGASHGFSPVPADDAAAQVPLVVVELPAAVVRDTSTGSLPPHLLDGIRYASMQCSKSTRLVINASYGGLAGPHDGQTLIEQAMGEMHSREPNRLAIVLPAGNGRESLCHAQLVFDARHEKRHLNWQVQPDSATPSFAELWFDNGADIDDAEIELIPPTGTGLKALRVKRTGPDQARALHRLGSNEPIAWVVKLRRSASSMGRSMALIAIAPTAVMPHRKRSLAPHGCWTVKLRMIAPTDHLEVAVWLRRNDRALGQKLFGRQSWLFDPNYVQYEQIRPNWPPHNLPDSPGSQVKRSGTSNGLACGNGVTMVGGFRLSDHRPAAYSGTGSSTPPVPTPSQIEPSDENTALNGLRVIAHGPTDSVRMWGTSLASPLWARHLINAWA